MQTTIVDPKPLFTYWVQEREFIRQAKEKGNPHPWSDDPVFQETYFCNVRREDDKVTRGIRELHNVYHDDPHELAAWNLTVARMVNNVSSLVSMAWPFDKSPRWKESFLAIMARPGSWGDAYIVSTNGRAQPKHEYVLGLLEQALEQLYGPPAAVLGGTLASAHTRLQAVSGLGSFMAAQVVADLKNTTWHPLHEAEDWYTFSAPGPGSLRGLSRFHEKKVTPKGYHQALQSARVYVQASVPGLIDELCDQDLQNCFCEYDKYLRVLTGEGRSKRKYRNAP